MGKIIFLFFLCYNAVITEKYIVIRIRDDSGNRSISNLPGIQTFPLPIDVAELGPKLTSTKRLEGDYKSKSGEATISIKTVPASRDRSVWSVTGKVCNTLRTTVTLRQSRMTSSRVASTRMLCQGEAGKTEMKLGHLLSNLTGMSLDEEGNVLTITAADQKMEFSRIDKDENIGLSGDVKKNTEIGALPSWGPEFRISFDLMVNSLSGGTWLSVLSFKRDGGKRNIGKIGDRIPGIYLNKKGFLHFASGVNRNRNYKFNFDSIKLKKWYSILIEQSMDKGKIFYSISVDGKEIHRVENKNPLTFEDVKIFAGDKFYPAADASYRNLVWEIGFPTQNLDGDYKSGETTLNITAVENTRDKSVWSVTGKVCNLMSTKVSLLARQTKMRSSGVASSRRGCAGIKGKSEEKLGNLLRNLTWMSLDEEGNVLTIKAPDQKMEFSRIGEEETEGLAGEVRRDNQLGTIHGSRWGPFFRLSLQLFIRSKSKGWATILAFKASENNHGAHGDRIPALFLNGDQLHFRSSISGNANYKLQSRVTLNKWFTVVVEQHSVKGKVYFTVTVDGKKVANVENKNPRRFKDVDFYAGDKFHPAADASYRHLVWENLGVSGVVKKNTEIGTIPSWGPQYRVRFDVKINSLRFGNRGGWSSIISFKRDGGKRNGGVMGDRNPAIFLNKKGFLTFASGVNGNPNHNFNFNSIKLKKWYSIEIAQTRDKGKIFYSVSVDGKEIHRVENKKPLAFPDVRVLAGDRFQPAADASYRNLVWENIGLSGVVKKNTEIGTIPSWGPLYRISFDLKVNSLSRTVWTNVISFRGNGAKNNHGNLGDRIPAVFMHSNGRLHFSSSVGAKPSYNANSPVPLKKWLYVIIEQYPLNGKVYFTVTIDGKKLANVENKNPRTFEDVRVFAGDKFYPATDAIYRHLVWETGYSGSFRKDNLVTTLPEWGPTFYLSLHAKLNSIRAKDGWLIQLIEASKDEGSGCCEVGTRVPALKLDKKEGQLFEFAMGVEGESFSNTKYQVKKDKWYRIVVTQRPVDKKYWFDIFINDVRIVHRENEIPKMFKDVKVYAGRKNNPIADGIYKNLVFKTEGGDVEEESEGEEEEEEEEEEIEQEEGFFGNFKRNNLLATLPKWGPIFSVSLDIKLNSLSGNGLLRLIQFIEASKEAGKKLNDVGARVPAINIYQKEGKTFEFAMGLGKKDFTERKYKVKKGKWYSILITQKLEDGTYWFDVSINDERIIHQENKYPKTFFDVKVYAWRIGDGVDGIYRNFFFQHEDTETINGKNELKGFVENIATNKALLTGFVDDKSVSAKPIGKNEVKGLVENVAVNNALLDGLVNDKPV